MAVRFAAADPAQPSQTGRLAALARLLPGFVHGLDGLLCQGTNRADAYIGGSRGGSFYALHPDHARSGLHDVQAGIASKPHLSGAHS